MKKIFFVTLIVLLASSCREKSSDIFTNTIQIKHQKVFDTDELVFRNGEMLYMGIDSSLIIQNFSDDFLLTKVRLKDNKVSYLLPVGNGPGQFVSITLSQKETDSTILFQDDNSSQVYRLNVVSGKIENDFFYGDSRVLRMIKANNLHIATGIFKEAMFSIWNNNSQTYLCEYPEDNMKNINSATKSLAYQGKLLVNEELDRILFCSKFFSYFEIFQIDQTEINSLKKSYIGEYLYKPSSDENLVYAHPYENNREGYTDAYVTNKRIYLLYSGRSISDINIDSHEKASLANKILVYDWNGVPISKYITNVDLDKICVNEAENVIYAIAFNPDPEIVFFQLVEL